MKSAWIVIGSIVLGVIVLFGLIQLVPYGRNHINPPVVQEPNWDSSETRALAKTACFDCHSNETIWPWYSNIAPFSWLVQRDVDEGRRRLNFSEWGGRIREVNEISEVVLEGEMPPIQYTLIHKAARLTQQQKIQLANGLASSLR